MTQKMRTCFVRRPRKNFVVQLTNLSKHSSFFATAKNSNFTKTKRAVSHSKSRPAARERQTDSPKFWYSFAQQVFQSKNQWRWLFNLQHRVKKFKKTFSRFLANHS